MKLIDLHCDTALKIFESTTGEGLKENSFDIDLKGMEAGGTLAQFFACFLYKEMFPGADGWDEAFAYAKKMIRRMQKEVEENSEKIAFACCAEDILKNQEEHKISAILTVEEGGIIGGKLARLQELYDAGVRLVTLTWNYENCIGFPNSRDTELMSKGLKPFGFETVERMNELGMLVDVSHLSDGGFWDVIRTSKAPVVASHSNARTLCDHPRNLTDEMLKALGENGGVTGLNFYPAFVNPQQDAKKEDFVRHISYIVHVAGIEAAAVGTDFDGFDEGTLEIDHVSKMPLLYDALRAAHFTEEEIEKIFFKNALRVISDAMR